MPISTNSRLAKSRYVFAGARRADVERDLLRLNVLRQHLPFLHSLACPSGGAARILDPGCNRTYIHVRYVCPHLEISGEISPLAGLLTDCGSRRTGISEVPHFAQAESL